MVGKNGGMFIDGGVPGPRQAAELALLSAAVREWVAGEAPGGGRGDQQAPHSALGMRSPAEFYAEWLVKDTPRPVQI